MEDLIGLFLFVIVMAASAVGSMAERRKRRAQQEARESPSAARVEPPREKPADKAWQAQPEEVRRFLENLERRLTGEGPQAPVRTAPETARSVPGTPPVLSPRTRQQPRSPAHPSRSPAVPAQVRTAARIQPRRPVPRAAPPRPGAAPAEPAPARAVPATVSGHDPTLHASAYDLSRDGAETAAAGAARKTASVYDTTLHASAYDLPAEGSQIPDLLLSIVENRDSLRRAVIAREILGPPRSMTI